MTYLLANFWGWLLAALVLGAIIGFSTFSRTIKGYWPDKWPTSLIAFILAVGAGVFVAFSTLFPERSGLWLETSVLLLISYLLGCFLGSAFGACYTCRTTCAVPATADIKSTSSTPLGFVSTQEAPALGADEMIIHPGFRPTSLERGDDEGDDLKIILGIAEVNETRLHELGVYYFHQIADWTPENIEWVGSYLAFPGRIERENWVGQAKGLLEGIDPTKG